MQWLIRGTEVALGWLSRNRPLGILALGAAGAAVFGTQSFASVPSVAAARVSGSVQASQPASLTFIARPTKPRYSALLESLRNLPDGRQFLIANPTAGGRFEFSLPAVGVWDFEAVDGTRPVAALSSVAVTGSLQLLDLCLSPDPVPCAHEKAASTPSRWLTRTSHQAAKEEWKEVEYSIWKVVEGSGKPVSGVLVAVDGKVVGETDAHGQVQVPSLGATARKLEFIASDGRALTPNESQQRLANFALSPPIQSCLATVAPLERVAGAVARWASDPGVFSVSDKEGCFKLPRLRAEDVILIDKIGFVPMELELSSLRKGARLPHMTPMAPVLGMVVDDEGKPVASADVRYGHSEAKPAPSWDLQTDSRGFFALMSVSAGNYLVSVKAAELGAVSRVVKVGSFGSKPRWETFVLAPAGSVRGRVVQEEGLPVAGAVVALVQPGSAVIADRIGLGDRRALKDAGVRHLTTSQDGKFRFSGIPEGTYDLVARARQGSKQIEGLAIPSEGSDLGDLVVSQGPRLKIRVVSEEGQPVDKAQVALGTIRTAPIRFSLEHEASPQSTDADGVAIFEGLAPDSVVGIQVSAPGFSEYEGSLSISSGEVHETVRIHAAPQVCGRVASAKDGRGIAGATVGLRIAINGESSSRSTRGNRNLTRSNHDGTFCLNSSALGVQTLFARAEGFGAAELSVLVDEFGIDGEEILLETVSIVEGEVTNSDGEQVMNAAVWLGSAAAVTDQNGRYRLGTSELGWLELGARHADYGRVARLVHVSGETNVEEDLVFPAGTEVAGRVLLESGEPLAGATVQLLEAADDPAAVRVTRTDSKGHFAFVNVTAASYRLSAVHREIGRTEEVLSIDVAGEPLFLEVIVKAGRRLFGRVIGLDTVGQAVVRASDPNEVSRTAAVSDDGSFDFGPVGAAVWRLTLWISGKPVSGETIVDMSTDDSTPVSVILHFNDRAQR